VSNIPQLLLQQKLTIRIALSEWGALGLHTFFFSVVFSIHNMNYGLPLIAEAMQFANRCTTVSPTYALEISGEPAIAPHMSKFLGIRNGIDGDIWDPQV
jgi:starch synthase